MTTRKYHLSPLAPGVQIYADRLDVAGIARRRGAAAQFIQGRDQRLELQPEPSNSHDKNAIRVHGYSKGWFWHRCGFLGYVSKDVAKVIAEGQFWPDIQPRLLKTYLSDGGFVEVQFQLVGPKRRAAEFKAAFSTDDHYTGAVEKVKYLKAEERFEEAVDLLSRLLDEIESEAREKGPGWGVAPWYYEQLAIIHRKQGRIRDEINVLERYMAQTHAPGTGPKKLSQRLEKARARR